MSGTVRAGLVFGLAAVGAIIGSTLLPIPCLGLLSVVALGLGAGYTAAKTTNATREQRLGRGATAGAIAGAIALVGGAIVVGIITQMPFYQDTVQNQLGQVLQDPNFADSGLDPAQIAGFASAAGIIGGICGGIINFLVMLICGLLGALLWKGAPATADYVAAGGTHYNQPGYTPSDYGTQPGGYIPPSGAGTQPGSATQYGGQPQQPTQYGGQYTPPTQDQGGARVYDPDDPNRSQ